MTMPVAMQSHYWVRLYRTVAGLHQTLKCYTAPKESQSQRVINPKRQSQWRQSTRVFPVSFPVRATPGATATGYFVLFNAPASQTQVTKFDNINVP
jgi:hypothetical protein